MHENPKISCVVFSTNQWFAILIIKKGQYSNGVKNGKNTRIEKMTFTKDRAHLTTIGMGPCICVHAIQFCYICAQKRGHTTTCQGPCICKPALYVFFCCICVFKRRKR